MDEYGEKMEIFKRHVSSTEQKAMECLSLLKFSEGLVKRDINLVRIQIDLHLKKIERQTLAELQKVYSSEKDIIEEVLTNLKFLSESAKSFPDKLSIVVKEQEVLEERKKIYRKRLVFEANTQLTNAIDSLNTFGRTIVKELKQANSDPVDDVENLTDPESGTRNDINRQPTNEVGYRSTRLVEEKTNIIGEKVKDLSDQGDPFAILRSLRKIELAENFSEKRKVCKKASLNGNKSHCSESKHVKFVDDIGVEDAHVVSALEESNLKQRGRMLIGYDNKRRARSASPRRSNFNSNTKRDKLHGILKNATKSENGYVGNQHLCEANSSYQVPSNFLAMNLPENKRTEQSKLYEMSDNIRSHLTNFRTECSIRNGNIRTEKLGYCFYQIGDKGKVGTLYNTCDSKSVDISVYYPIRDEETDAGIHSVRASVTENPERFASARNGSSQVDSNRKTETGPNSNSVIGAHAYFETHNSKSDPISTPRQKSSLSRSVNGRLRLPSFDEMLYIKD